MTIDTAFTRFPSLTTNRLFLRQIQPEDAEALFATFSDEEAMRFYGHEPHRSLDDTKEFTVANSIRNGVSLETLKAEIAKCDVLCANCHAIETQNERYKRKGISF